MTWQGAKRRGLPAGPRTGDVGPGEDLTQAAQSHPASPRPRLLASPLANSHHLRRGNLWPAWGLYLPSFSVRPGGAAIPTGRGWSPAMTRL